jgi:hypothetical protein
MIDTIYQEYGDAIYLENADSDLLNIEKNYLLNGDFWVETDKEENAVLKPLSVPHQMETAIYAAKSKILK